MTHKVIIIGSGPAGYCAGLYAARANLNPLLFRGKQPGGQLITTTNVENYLGLHEIDGFELTQQFAKHAEKYGLTIIDETVITVEKDNNNGGLFTVYTGDPNDEFKFISSTGDLELTSKDSWCEIKKYKAQTVIIATGATAKRLYLPSEEKYWNKGISACAVCDGALPMFRNQPLAVVGGGDTAMEEALFLSNFSSQVYLLHRSDKFRASDIMMKRVKECSKITIITNTVLLDVEGDSEGELSHIQTKNLVTQEIDRIAVRGLFYAIGHVPNTAFLKKSTSVHVDIDEHGYIRTVPGSTVTNEKNLFACGDVQDKKYRQAITAAGSGCMAALDVQSSIH